MKVQIVSYEEPDRWILGKFARKLTEHLGELDVDVTLGRTPDPDADVNHHICYVNYDGFSTGINTLMVTHVDSVGKLRLLKRQLETADLAVCMSADTAHNLRGASLSGSKICYVNPAHDEVLSPRRIRVGITTRLYDDGRKNEASFEAMLDRLPRDDLHFVIMGEGWRSVVDRMRGLDISVDHHPEFDLERYWKLIPTLDYYVYFGHDEGSMGFVDAVAAGVATIVTPQGYHLDVEGGITHSIESLDDLASTLTGIVEERRNRVERVSGWTWRRYTEKHLDLWHHLMEEDPIFARAAIGSASQKNRDGLASLQTDHRTGLGQRAKFLLRIAKTSVRRRLDRPTRSDSSSE